MTSFYPGNPTDGAGNPLAAVVTFKLYGPTPRDCAVEVSADPRGRLADLVSEDSLTRSSAYERLADVLHEVSADAVTLLG